MKRSSIAVAFVVLAAMSGRAPASIAPPVYAHRGGAALAPENTLGAFRNAAALYAQNNVDGWLEMDSQLDADGTLLVIHDHSVDRTTDCSGFVIQMTDAQLAGCNAAAKFTGWPSVEPIPRLKDVLIEGRDAGWKLMIEIKDIPTEKNFEPTGITAATALVDLIHAVAFPSNRLIIESFWPPALDQVQRLDPSIPTMFLTLSDISNGIGVNFTENVVYSTARNYPICSPDMDAPDLDASMVANAHTLGRAVIVWTVDSRADVARVEAAGVDGIITNDPRLLF